MLVTVEEAPATTIGYGGGVEAFTMLRSTGPDGQAEDQLEFAPRGFFDIGRRNLFGANRSVNLYTRVSLRPRDAPDDPRSRRHGHRVQRVSASSAPIASRAGSAPTT